MPVEDVVEEVLRTLQTAEDYRYFFDSITSPDWVEPLSARGFFRVGPTPEFSSEGRWVSFPDWPELNYLLRLLPEHADLVVPLLVSIDVQGNARIRDRIVDAGLIVDGENARAIAHTVQPWLDEGLRFLNYINLCKLSAQLYRQGASDESFALTFRLMEPLPNGEAVSSTRLSARASEWEFEEGASVIVSAYSEEPTAACLELFADLAEAAVKLIRPQSVPPEDDSIWIRPAIEVHEQNEHHDEVFGIVTDSLRNLCEAASAGSVADLAQVVGLLEARQWTFFSRVSLHLIRTNLPLSIELAKEFIFGRSLISNLTAHREYWLLCRDAFLLLTPEERVKLLRLLEEESERRAGGEAERIYWLEFQALSVLAPTGSELVSVRLQELAQEFGPPLTNAEFLMYMSSGWVGPTSPLEAGAIEGMSAREVLAHCLEWVPSGEWQDPTREGLGREVAQTVAQRPMDFEVIVPFLVDLHATYVRAVVEGWSTAARELRALPWPAAFATFDWILARPVEPEEAGRRDEYSGWGGSRRSVAGLLAVALNESPTELPIEFRGEVWPLLAELSRDPDPTPEREAGEAMGPVTTAINSTRCLALSAIIEYALWVRRHTSDEGLPPEVEAVLAEHLDPQHDPSPAVRAVFGQRVPWLISLDEEWVRAHLSSIFDESDPGRRDAAWGAFIRYTNPYTSGLRVLRAQYEGATERLGDPVREGGWDEEQVAPRLGQHLILFYLRGEISLEDPLLLSYFENAPGPLRAKTLSYLGRLLGTDEDVPDEVLVRAIEFWAWRTGPDADPRAVPEELMSIGTWVSAKKLSADWRLAELTRTMSLTRDHIDDDRQAVRALAYLADEAPIACMRLSMRLVRADTEGWLASASVKPFTRMIEAGLSAGGEARDVAVEFANFIGAMGFRQFRELISGI